MCWVECFETNWDQGQTKSHLHDLWIRSRALSPISNILQVETTNNACYDIAWNSLPGSSGANLILFLSVQKIKFMVLSVQKIKLTRARSFHQNHQYQEQRPSCGKIECLVFWWFWKFIIDNFGNNKSQEPRDSQNMHPWALQLLCGWWSWWAAGKVMKSFANCWKLISRISQLLPVQLRCDVIRSGKCIVAKFYNYQGGLRRSWGHFVRDGRRILMEKNGRWLTSLLTFLARGDRHTHAKEKEYI